MTTTTARPGSVALSQLVPDPVINSRLMEDAEALDQLATNIEQVGLILPLAVRPIADGKFAIIDGHRRHAALKKIAEKGGDNDPIVPVLLREADNADARTLSLAANIMRLPLHPADQYEAFKALRDEGLEVEQIASRFALTRKEVEQRLALGSVTAEGLALYRKGALTLEDMKLLACTAADRQAAAIAGATDEDGNIYSWKLRELLREKTINTNDPIRKLVTEDEYAAAGGRVERDLFGTIETSRWPDYDIAVKLAHAKIDGLRQKLLAEGWAWVKHEKEIEGTWQSWRREYAEQDFEDPADREAYDKIDAELDETNPDDPDAKWTEEMEAKYGALDEQRNALEKKMVPIMPAEKKAYTGCLIRETFDVVYGLVAPGTKVTAEGKAEVKQPETKEEKPKSTGEDSWPESIMLDLESIATNAAQLALTNEPLLADCLLLATMYQDCLSGVTPKKWLAHNSADRYSNVEHNSTSIDISKKLKAFGLKGSDAFSLADQILAMDDSTRNHLRALLVARSLKKLRRDDAKKLFEATETQDLDAVWKPEKEFFERFNKGQLLAICKEIDGRGFIDTAKKSEAAQFTATKAAAAGWVPKWMRCMLKKDRQAVAEKPKKEKKEKEQASGYRKSGCNNS